MLPVLTRAAPRPQRSVVQTPGLALALPLQLACEWRGVPSGVVLRLVPGDGFPLPHAGAFLRLLDGAPLLLPFSSRPALRRGDARVPTRPASRPLLLRADRHQRRRRVRT